MSNHLALARQAPHLAKNEQQWRVRYAMTTPKRFVSWIAVSSLPQAKKISLEDQLATNKEHIEKWGGRLVEELSVPGKSRSIVTWEEACDRIDAYAQLRDLINARAFDVLIYRDNSRLGRTTSLVVTIAELCHRAGIVMYATDAPPPNLDKPKHNLATRITDVFQSVIAQDEIEKFRRRNEMGMKARVMRGDFPGKPPFGWEIERKIENNFPVTVVKIDEAAAVIIRTIVDLYLRKGWGLRPIATHLNAHGYKTPAGRAWYISAVQHLLDLIWRYAGYVEINSKPESAREYVRAKSKWPAIISEDDARAVEKERRYRAEGKRRVTSNHRFSGVVWCGKCQRRMSATSEHIPLKRHPDRKRRRDRYVCSDIETTRRHPQAEIAASYVMAAVREAFEFSKDEGNRATILARSENKSDIICERIREIETAIARQDEALQRADDAYVDGAMDLARYNQQMARIKAQWATLQGELAECRHELEQEAFGNRRGERIEEVAHNGLAMLESEDISTANAWLREHIRVWIYNERTEDRIEVEYL